MNRRNFFGALVGAPAVAMVSKGEKKAVFPAPIPLPPPLCFQGSAHVSIRPFDRRISQTNPAWSFKADAIKFDGKSLTMKLGECTTTIYTGRVW